MLNLHRLMLLFALTGIALEASPSWAECTSDAHKYAWGPTWVTRLADANCTCEIWARSYQCRAGGDGVHAVSGDVRLWAISVLGGCHTTCEKLPGWSQVAALAPRKGIGYQCDSTFVDRDLDGYGSCIDANDHDARVGVTINQSVAATPAAAAPPDPNYAPDYDPNNGFPPWECGNTRSGPQFMTCADADRHLRAQIQCQENCGCQVEFDRQFEANCGESHFVESQCGRACVCLGQSSINPFSPNCDCSSNGETTCNSEIDENGNVSMGGCTIFINGGVSPGPNAFRPATCTSGEPAGTPTGTTGHGFDPVPSPSDPIPLEPPTYSPAPVRVCFSSDGCYPGSWGTFYPPHTIIHRTGSDPTPAH